jgi:KDO2-lipid IV(A) lauroyltransferase
MAAVVYYLSLPLIYLVSWLPFPLLYLLSDFMYLLIYRVIGYRKEVVFTNLKNSFPEKTASELLEIQRKFYRYFCDLILETLKTLTISPEAVRKRVSLGDISAFKRFKKEGRSVIMVLGHFGNWELGGARYSQEPLPHLYVIYHPLANKYFNRLIYHMRTRHGTRLYPMRETTRRMLEDRDKLTTTAFIADQTPSPERAHWMEFLNQDTPVFTGTARLSRKLDFPIVYVSIKRLKRGSYRIDAELLIEDPKAYSEAEISEIHTRRLEKDIREMPEIWLWTNRRWKHKRPK